MKIIFKIAKILLLIYVIFIALLVLFQDKLLFHPQKTALEYIEPRYDGFRYDPYEEFYLKHINGTTINVQLTKSNFKSKGVIYYLHGNRGNISAQKIDLPKYLDRGYDVFMIDYQGYGKSEGKPSKIALEEDVILGFDFLNQKYSQDSILILGHSMGSFPATYCATKRNPKALILMAPIYKVSDILKYKVPLFIPPFNFRCNLDNSVLIDLITCPAHIFIAKSDHMIPFKSTIKFKQHLNDRNTLTIAKRAGHNNMIGDKAVVEKLNTILGQLNEMQ